MRKKFLLTMLSLVLFALGGAKLNAQVARVNGTEYETLTAALTVAKAMTSDVTVEIYDKVTLNESLTGSYSSIKFVGKAEKAEIYLDIQGYSEAAGKKVAFEGLKLSKVAGGYVANAGFMNLAFGVYGVTEATYTNCTFLNGAYASTGDVTFVGCTFYRSHDRYGLWVYGDVNATVDGCTFADIRGIKMYDEGKESVAALTVKNTDFTAADNKPAIVLTYGESVTLLNNTYSSKGVFELDLDGAPNGTPVTSDVYPTCVNDNGACGVLVDGKIYTTAAQAAAVATKGSNVTLLHNSAETVEFVAGVKLNKNGFEAAGVTVKVEGVAKIGETYYETFAAAYNAAQTGDEIILLDDVKLTGKLTIGKSITIDGNGHSIIADETATWYTVGKFNIKSYKTHLVSINADGINLKDVVLDCNNNAAGINVYCAQGVVFNNVSIINATKDMAALTVNGSTVTTKTAFTALGNGVAIDISNGSGVTSDLGFAVEEGTVFDCGNKTVKFASVANVSTMTNAVDANGKPYFAAKDNAYYYTIAQMNSRDRATAYSNGLTILTDVEITKALNVKEPLNLNGHSVVTGEDSSETLPERYASLQNLDGKYVIGIKPTATIENLGSMVVKAGEYFVKNLQGSGDNSKDMPLQFVMKYTADQSAEDVAESPYKTWYADFVLSFTGLSNGKFVADEETYLAGFYGETEHWEGIWAKVGITGMEITEGTRYPVMMGVGMPQDYEYICAGVEEFLCAMNISSDILKDNPNLVVTLELSIVDSSNDDQALDALQTGNDKCNVVAEKVFGADDFEKVELPEVEVIDIKSSLKDSDPDLTFALNFKIKDADNLTQEYLEKLFAQYGDWYTDYVLTISGLSQESVTFNANGGADGYLAGQYDAWSENWVSVPFDDVTLANGESIYIMEYAAKLMGKTGLRFTLAEVAEIVQNFDCGVFFTPEFLAANPGMKVDLQLVVFTEDEQGVKTFYNNGPVASNSFDVTNIAAVVSSENKQSQYYDTFAKAYAAAGDVVSLIRDAQGAGIVIDKNVTIDFNGYTYTFVSPAVGSNGTQTLGFQILKDNDVTLTNGTLNVAAEAGESFAMLIQNYADLTLTDMTLDGDNLNRNNYSYVLSNNSGKVVINGATNIIANVVEGENHYALDSYDYSPNYTLPVVTVNTTGRIIGAIEVSATLNLKAVGEDSNINVIIAGNGQLYNDVPVTVSMTKAVESYQVADNELELESGWYTISAPFAVTPALTEGYELFRYNEAAAMWENHKNQEHNTFGLEVGRGYLYAHANGADLNLEGVANINGYSTELSYTTDATHELKGFHLVGNPYTFSISGNHFSGDVADGFYTLANSGAWVVKQTANEIAVGEGFLVQAKSATKFAINKKATKTRSADNGSLQINVANAKYSDVAYVSFNEGVGLNKISHQNTNIPMVYVPVEGENYSIAYMNANVEEIPFAFEAKTMGSYTISVEAQNCEFSTMTLIDRFTGIETNLLFEDYSFIAKSSDNSNRFIIRLSQGTTDLEEEHFAYINNNGLIINNASSNATLQIFDVMGRPVSSHNLSGNANIAVESLTNGVYILRLIDDNKVRVQKVVID